MILCRAVGYSRRSISTMAALRPYYLPDEPDPNADWLQKNLSVYIMEGGTHDRLE